MNSGRLVLTVGASLGLLLVLYYVLAQLPAVATVAGSATAHATRLALAATGTEASVDGILLESGSARFLVTLDCTPLGPVMLLSGAILAFPAPLKARLKGVAMGALLLSALNIVRVASLVYVARLAPGWLDPAHLLVWQSGMVLAGIAIWLAWIRRVAYARSA